MIKIKITPQEGVSTFSEAFYMRYYKDASTLIGRYDSIYSSRTSAITLWSSNAQIEAPLPTIVANLFEYADTEYPPLFHSFVKFLFALAYADLNNAVLFLEEYNLPTLFEIVAITYLHPEEYQLTIEDDKLRELLEVSALYVGNNL